MEHPPGDNPPKRAFFVLERILTPQGNAWQIIPLEEALWAIEEDSFAKMIHDADPDAHGHVITEGIERALQALQQQKAITLPEDELIPLTDD